MLLLVVHIALCPCLACLSSTSVWEMQDDSDIDPVQRAENGFGERVRNARLRRKWTQRQLAERLQLDASAISRLEQGLRAVRLGEAALIARALDTDLEQLVFSDDIDPAEALQSLQESADRQMDETRSTAIELANTLLQMVSLVEEHPGFFGTIELSEDGPTFEIARESLLAGGLQRINDRYAASRSRHRVVIDDEQLATRINSMIEAAVQDVVSTVALPPTDLARGLASLKPTGVDEHGNYTFNGETNESADT